MLSLTITERFQNPCTLLHLAQGVEYDSLSILRIDYKYNPVARDAQAAQLKQYRSQILNREKW